MKVITRNNEMVNSVITALVKEVNDTIIHAFRLQLRTLVDNLCHVYNEGTLPEEVQKGNAKKKSHAKKKSYASTRVESLDGTSVDLHKKPPATQAVNPSTSNRKPRKQKVNEAITDDSAFKKRQPVVKKKETSTKKRRAILSKTEVV